MKYFYFLFLSICLISCGKNKIQENAPILNESELIGGKEPASTQFRSAIRILNNCTASKVGKRLFMLAGHCVIDSATTNVRLMFTAGNTIYFKTHYLDWHVAKIKNVYVHRSYLDVREMLSGLNQSPFGAGFKSSDLAFFTIDSDTPDIETARIDLGAVRENEQVIIGGNGCETGVHQDKPNYHYKIAEAKTINIYQLLYSDPAWRIYEIINAFNYAFFTLGQATDPSYASLCPGDSGGPVYRPDGKTIVGVNTYYLFQPDHPEIPAQNAHTRLDKPAPWIKEVFRLSGEVFDHP